MNQQFLQTKDGQNLQIRFLELRKKLSALEWITHGSVTPTTRETGNGRQRLKRKPSPCRSLRSKPISSRRLSQPTGRPNPSSGKCVPLAKKSSSNPLPEPAKNQAAKSSQMGLNLVPFGSATVLVCKGKVRIF